MIQASEGAGSESLAGPAEDRSRAIRRVVADKVTKRFGATLALRGVSATFNPGLSLIVGPNGSGKTTLLGLLGSTLRATAGVVDYEPLGEASADVRGHIGWVSHEALAYADLSARQNVRLAAEAHGLEPSRAWEEARNRFELDAFGERPLKTLSRGQRQRTALARALVADPGLLLLDEPSTGLDSAGIDRLLSVIEAEVNKRRIVVLVAHDVETFRGITSVRVVLDRGRRVE